MKAARIHEWGAPLVVEEIDEPEPLAGQVRVQVDACGIGLTVLHYSSAPVLANMAQTQLPRIPGHEYVGTIDAVGPGVDPARIGERVFAYFHLTCGTCRRCLGASEQMCERHGGVIGAACDGGYAEFAVLPERNALRLPAEIGAVDATTIADAIATPVHAAARAGIAAGERVAVIGAGGGVGIHMVQVAEMLGATAVGLDIDAAKLEFLERELGVAAANSSDFAAIALPAAWNGEVDVVFDFVGIGAGHEWALRMLAPHGRLVCLTAHTTVSIAVLSRDLVTRQLAVLGSKYTSRAEAAHTAALVAQGRVRPVVTQRVDIDGIEAVHDALRQGTLIGRAAVVFGAPA